MNTFAVIKTGGKQYKVSEGELLKIEKIPAKDGKKELVGGDKIAFDEVLMIANDKDAKVGNPTIKGAKVEGELIDVGRSAKIRVVKFKSKSRYFKRHGHRQNFFKVKINKIA